MSHAITLGLCAMVDADYFVEKAEQCFRLARLARSNPSNDEIANDLDAMGEEFMNIAVVIDTARQQSERA
jgi:hypothetical protein